MLLCQWATLGLYFSVGLLTNTSYNTCMMHPTAQFQIYVEGRPISHLVDVGSGTGKLSLTAITFVRIMMANLRMFGRIICTTCAAVRPYNASLLSIARC